MTAPDDPDRDRRIGVALIGAIVVFSYALAAWAIWLDGRGS